MTDLKILREVATQAARRNWMDADMQEFDDAFRPVSVLSLLDRIEELEGAERRAVSVLDDVARYAAVLAENRAAFEAMADNWRFDTKTVGKAEREVAWAEDRLAEAIAAAGEIALAALKDTPNG